MVTFSQQLSLFLPRFAWPLPPQFSWVPNNWSNIAQFFTGPKKKMLYCRTEFGQLYAASLNNMLIRGDGLYWRRCISSGFSRPKEYVFAVAWLSIQQKTSGASMTFSAVDPENGNMQPVAYFLINRKRNRMKNEDLLPSSIDKQEGIKYRAEVRANIFTIYLACSAIAAWLKYQQFQELINIRTRKAFLTTKNCGLTIFHTYLLLFRTCFMKRTANYAKTVFTLF